jgi:ubiquitin C-terminal hydrolase
MEATAEDGSGKVHRCLGIGCNRILTNGQWFCPACKEKKDSHKNSALVMKSINMMIIRNQMRGGLRYRKEKSETD